MVISNARIRQIITEQIQRLNEDVAQVLANFRTYKQQIDNFLFQLSSFNTQDQNAYAFLNTLHQYLYAVSLALGRCIQSNTINESGNDNRSAWKRFWQSGGGRDILKGVGKKGQISNIPGFLNDIGIPMPGFVTKGVESYRKGRDWAENMGVRYNQMRQRKKEEEEMRRRQQQQQQNQQNRSQQPNQQQQNQQQQQNMPYLTMSELNGRYFDMFHAYQQARNGFDQNSQQRIDNCMNTLNAMFREYESVYTVPWY